MKRMQSKLSEGSDSGFLCCHCSQQLVVKAEFGSHCILQFGTADEFDRLYCAVV